MRHRRVYVCTYYNRKYCLNRVRNFYVQSRVPFRYEDLMNVLMCDSTAGSLSPLAQTLNTSPEIRIVDVVRNGRDMVRALKEHDVHLSVLAPEVLDLDLVVEKSRGFAPQVKKVVVAQSPSTTMVIKAHQYGISDVIPLETDTASLLERFKLTIAGQSEIHNHPMIQSLHVKNGQANKSVLYEDEVDMIILQLLSLGMSDQEISMVSATPLQLVRNRIANLILINDVTNRTQLAVLQARNLLIPDFA